MATFTGAGMEGVFERMQNLPEVPDMQTGDGYDPGYGLWPELLIGEDGTIVEGDGPDIGTDGAKVEMFNFGSIRLIGRHGGDRTIANCARNSIHDPSRKRAGDRGLIRTLVRERHTSPLEFAGMTFRVRLPIFLARQWIRHRTAKVNEMSGRYSVMRPEFHRVGGKRWRGQHPTNRQMSGSCLPNDLGERAERIYRQSIKLSDEAYRQLLGIQDGNGVTLARELARATLPLSTMTVINFQFDLHNLMHFLGLRMANDAQPEGWPFASVISAYVKRYFPEVFEAYMDYVWGSITLSRLEVEACLSGTAGSLSGRELEAFKHKLKRINPNHPLLKPTVQEGSP